MRKVFPFVDFLRDNSVQFEYREGLTELETGCRFCDFDHTGKMMGINTATGMYGCWYSADHKGGNPVRFVMAWLDCTKSHAISVVNEYTGNNLEDLMGMLESWGVTMDDEPEEDTIVLEFPDTFVRIDPRKGMHRRFSRYLVSRRGFDHEDVQRLIRIYGLRLDTASSIWRNRLIVPIYENKVLVTWQGRDIGDSDLRWLSLSEKKPLEGALAAGNIKHTIYNIDKINKGGDVLVISEGVFDALKVDFYGFKRKVRGGCMFGKSITDEQLFLLQQAASKYKQLVFVLDEGTGSEDVILALKFPDAKFEPMPKSVDDLGELTPKQANRFITHLLKKYT